MRCQLPVHRIVHRPITPPYPPEHTRSIATGSYPVPVGPHYTCRSLFLWVDRYVYPQTGYWSAPVARSLQWHPCGFGGLKEETPQGACRMSVSGVLAGLFFMRSSDTTHKKKIGYQRPAGNPMIRWPAGEVKRKGPARINASPSLTPTLTPLESTLAYWSRASSFSHRILCCNGCLSTRGRELQDQLLPLTLPTESQPAATRPVPSSSARV